MLFVEDVVILNSQGRPSNTDHLSKQRPKICITAMYELR